MTTQHFQSKPVKPKKMVRPPQPKFLAFMIHMMFRKGLPFGWGKK